MSRPWDAIREKFPKLHLHTNSKTAPPQHRNRANDFLHLGSLRITNRDTPGHAEEGVTYIIGNWPDDAPHVAIVGDAIFAGSMGRGNQSWDLARQKVREQIFSLPAAPCSAPATAPSPRWRGKGEQPVLLIADCGLRIACFFRDTRQGNSHLYHHQPMNL